MKVPSMAITIFIDAMDMYKKSTYKKLKTYEHMYSKESVDNANEWMQQIEDTKLFIATAISEYLENHKEPLN